MKLPQGLLEGATGRDGRMMGALTDNGFAEKVKGLILLIIWRKYMKG